MKYVIAKDDSRLVLTENGWQSEDAQLLDKAKSVVFDPYELTYAGSIVGLYISQVARAIKGEVIETDEEYEADVIY